MVGGFVASNLDFQKLILLIVLPLQYSQTILMQTDAGINWKTNPILRILQERISLLAMLSMC